MSLYRYDPETGIFWRRADWDDGDNGYRRISVTIDGKRILVKAHRAAVLCMTGRWPEDDVDHKDLDKSNNKWSNLRDATHGQNMSNVKLTPLNTSGYRNVSYRRDMNKFVAYVTHQGKRTHLGSFETAEEAKWVAQDHALHLKKEFYRSS